VVLAATLALCACTEQAATPPAAPASEFHLEEATISQIQQAIVAGNITAVSLVHQYLARIKAYNGTCVAQPDGILGRVTPIANAGQINALSTLNLRPANRKAFGFDERKARSLTDPEDNDPAMPDALEVAAELDRHFRETGQLVGPLHGVVIAIKDQYDTFDMRTTAGADAFYANDRPPDDATFVKRLREAGAIIIAKSNLGEYASPMARSSFGGTFCNPYDTTRYPGGSSSGSGSAVGANLVTCAIAEETGASIRTPARHNSAVGIAPTQELVSRDGMMGAGIHTRTGPICRTVEDAARILDVIAGYDPKDEYTVFSVDRLPEQPYPSYAGATRLEGMRIGVVREVMDRSLFSQADGPSIDLIERAIEDLASLGATMVDPGEGGALMQSCLNRTTPYHNAAAYVEQFPEQFPEDGDHIATLLDMTVEPGTGPGLTLRNLSGVSAEGVGRYYLNRYLRERGDREIRTIDDLITKARFFDQPDFAPRAKRKEALENLKSARMIDTAERMQSRFAFQQVVMQCMADLELDALTYPTGNVPAPVLGAPYEPNVNGRNGGSSWNLFGREGFPIITVPAGFTAQVYDRVRDADADDGTRLVGPVDVILPMGIDFVARPFAEPTLLRIASAYEAATRHRMPPPGFGPLPEE
jgi:Asp-tRNA(Asn)/Glu-tRNA(Gln) amidotransferase A subunit family amidase